MGDSNGLISETKFPVTPVDGNLCLSVDFCINIAILPKPAAPHLSVGRKIALPVSESVIAEAVCDSIASSNVGAELIASARINLTYLVGDHTSINDTIFNEHDENPPFDYMIDKERAYSEKLIAGSASPNTLRGPLFTGGREFLRGPSSGPPVKYIEIGAYLG